MKIRYTMFPPRRHGLEKTQKKVRGEENGKKEKTVRVLQGETN